MNTIPQKQNEPFQIDRLAAQRQLYSEAKAIQLLQLALAVPASLIWPLAVHFFPSANIYASVWGIVVSLLELILTAEVQSHKLLAARIQESFDCEVLEIGWKRLHSGKQPTPEEIHAASQRFDRSKGDRSKLIDWYPKAVSVLPLGLARIICQRANCWWDGNLRRRYSSTILASLASVSLLSVLIGVASDFSMAEYISSVAAPLLPVYLFAIKQAIDNGKAADSIDRLRDHTSEVWQKILASSYPLDSLSNESQELQCEIFSHRTLAPLVFDWAYYRLRDSHEEQMNVGAESLIKEAKRILKLK